MLRSGSRARPGAHRAPRSASRVRGSRAVKAGDGDSKAGVFGVGLRSRVMFVRLTVVAVLAVVVIVGLASSRASSAEPTVYQFLLDWQSRHYLQAAELTTGRPNRVAGELAGAYQDLGATQLTLAMTSISQQGSAASAQFVASVNLGSTGLTWSYRGQFRLRDGSGGWHVAWSPSVIMPAMHDGERLAVVTTEPGRSQLLDSAGQPLAVLSPVYEVSVVPGRLANPGRTAAAIAAVSQLPQDQVEAQIESAPSRQQLVLLTLQPSQAALRAKLAAIPGVNVQQHLERLFDSIAPDVTGSVGTETASVLRDNGDPYVPGTTVGLSGLQQAFQSKLTGTPRTEVVLQDKGRLARVLDVLSAGTVGKPVHTTLNSRVQIAADEALAQLPDSAAIVAVQPSSGQILAVASHQAAGMPALQPLSGRYRPGQSFTIISAAALLGTGLAPDSPVPCTSSNEVDGSVFVNDPPEQSLGRNSTFTTDFAHACATALAGLSMRLTSGDLAAAAGRFGIGGWQLPVSSYFAGSIGQPSGEVDLAADTIGDGDVQVSPLGMALAAAVVESGRWHPPSLVTDMADPGTATEGVVSGQVLTDLRGLMRQAAVTAAHQGADVDGSVYDQAGNAPFGTGKRLRISWFVGYQGNVAFAVVELGKSAYDSAAPLAGSFLKNLLTKS